MLRHSLAIEVWEVAARMPAIARFLFRQNHSSFIRFRHLGTHASGVLFTHASGVLVMINGNE